MANNRVYPIPNHTQVRPQPHNRPTKVFNFSVKYFVFFNIERLLLQQLLFAFKKGGLGGFGGGSGSQSTAQSSSSSNSFGQQQGIGSIGFGK